MAAKSAKADLGGDAREPGTPGFPTPCFSVR
jgi:hypothetical protein